MSSPVLAAIGDGALLTADRGGTVVIGVSAGQGARPVIMEIAEPRDMVADDVVVMAVMMASNRIVGRLRHDRRGDQHAREQARGKPFQTVHHALLKEGIIERFAARPVPD